VTVTLRSRLLEGETLPASWYSDPEVLRLEEERIFSRSWHYAGPITLAEQRPPRVLRAATWGPLAFECNDADAPPFEEVIGDLSHELVSHGLDPSPLVYRGRSREQVLEANWKVVVENFLECYHCPTAHKSFSKVIDVDPSSQFHYIWPDWTINVLPGTAHLRVIVFRPLTPDRTASFVDGFWAPGTPDSVIREIDAFGAEVGAEDRVLVESVQRGLRSGAIDHGRLLIGSERLIQHFQLLVQEALDG
jgi:choline monooxygenase